MWARARCGDYAITANASSVTLRRSPSWASLEGRRPRPFILRGPRTQSSVRRLRKLICGARPPQDDGIWIELTGTRLTQLPNLQSDFTSELAFVAAQVFDFARADKVESSAPCR